MALGVGVPVTSLRVISRKSYGGFRKLGVPTMMENQMEKKMENEMETEKI